MKDGRDLFSDVKKENEGNVEKQKAEPISATLTNNITSIN